MAKSKKSPAKKSSKGRNGGKLGKVGGIVLLLVLILFVVAYIGRNVYDSTPNPTLAEKSTIQTPTSKESVNKKEKSSKKKAKKAEPKSDAAKPSAAKSQKIKTDSSYPVGALSSLVPEKDLLPNLEFEYTSQLIRHLGYVVSYNADYKVPNWVLYELNYAETLGNIPRNNAFAVDPEVPEKQMAQLTDYRNSGYDRGHMAPNADLNWDVQAQNESFYLSNMAPQGHDFNAGIWLDLENQVRKWAERDSAVTIVCGPILPKSKAEADKMKKIGKGHVLVPEQFYKVVLSPFRGEVRAIAFLMPNHNEKEGRKNKPLQSYAVPVDSIEKLTGIDFFPALPDKIENKIEKQYNLKDWF